MWKKTGQEKSEYELFSRRVNPNLKDKYPFGHVTRFNPILSTDLDIIFERKFCAWVKEFRKVSI